jgi:hypothetical protein
MYMVFYACFLFFPYAIQESKLCKLMSRQTLITKNATKWNKIILTMTTKSTPAWTNISRRCRSSSWVLMAAPTNNCFLHNTRTHSTCMILNHTQIETSLNHTQTHSVLDHILHAHAKYYTKHTQDTYGNTLKQTALCHTDAHGKSCKEYSRGCWWFIKYKHK